MRETARLTVVLMTLGVGQLLGVPSVQAQVRGIPVYNSGIAAGKVRRNLGSTGSPNANARTASAV
jgi:hypothetical protein